MAEAIDIYGTAFKNGSVALLARIVGQRRDDAGLVHRRRP